ncbi:MAG: aminopeptidase P family protein [Clostridia bacterium]|nr:aminopeptidase P family protein [Clostridia bacterium]
MKERINRLRKVLKDKNLGAAVITSRPNTFYFSGFGGSSSVIIVSADEVYFATDFRYIEHAKELCGEFMTVEMFKTSADEYMAGKINEMGIDTVGFEESDVSQGRYAEWMTKMQGIAFAGIQSEVDTLRIKKDENEIKLIQKAVDISDGAFSHILKYIKPGVREFEIAAEIEFYMRRNGASAPAFETIVASGRRSSLPHGHASGKVIEAGDPVTMDFGALVDGYCSDMTRTVFAGKPGEKMIDIYNIVLEAQITSEKGVHAGRTGFEVDKISRDIIYGAGFEGCYGHGLGHGVGIMVHENPRLSEKSTTVLENGMVVTVEPGIYVANYGGVRIEDMVVVHGKRPVVLTKSTKEMIIL